MYFFKCTVPVIEKKRKLGNNQLMNEILIGKSVSQGLAYGKVVLLGERAEKVFSGSDSQFIPLRGKPEEQVFFEARNKASRELQDLMEKSLEDYSKIFEAHLAMLLDPELETAILGLIRQDHKTAAEAVCLGISHFEDLLSQSQSEFFQERKNDMEDVRQRLLRCLGHCPLTEKTYPEGTIICAVNVLPSEVARFSDNNVVAIVTQEGSATSHMTIIARSRALPVVVIPNILQKVSNGTRLLVDGLVGDVIIDPTPEQLSSFEKQKESKGRTGEKFDMLYSPNATRDGQPIGLFLNLGSGKSDEMDAGDPTDTRRAFASFCTDGVGLVRSEVFFLERESFPTEDELEAEYSRLLKVYSPRPVTIRTLDIGGDKGLPYQKTGPEGNPALGRRAIRFCLDHPSVFRTQIRALLRASVHGKLKIMLPMISCLEDLEKSRAEIEICKGELAGSKIAFDPSVKIGIMVETPSAAILAGKLARVVDFGSIGTNDLVQFTMAADRMNQGVESYYQTLNPAVLTLVKMTVEGFRNGGAELCVCGQMAGSAREAAILIGLGIRQLSMDGSSLPEVKKMICTHTIEEFEELAGAALKAGTEAEVLEILEKHGL